MSANECFAGIDKKLQKNPAVTSDTIDGKKEFGSSALKVFAMIVKESLVVKIALQRVEALVASGDGERFDPYNGRPMRDWPVLYPKSKLEWAVLVKVALEFVASKKTSPASLAACR